jgi:MFS family permease
MRPRGAPASTGVALVADLREGWRFVRRRSWLWATFGSAAIAYLLFMGPVEVLLPLLVKNELDGTAGELGLVFAAGGAGGVVMALVISQLSIPRRHVTFMYALLAFGITDLFFYALTNAPWQAMVIAFITEGALTGAVLVWNTLVQRAVPGELLGRVRSLDSFAAFALTPALMAVMGPAADVFGVRAVLAVAGIAASIVTVLIFLLPGMRETEGRISLSAG